MTTSIDTDTAATLQALDTAVQTAHDEGSANRTSFTEVDQRIQTLESTDPTDLDAIAELVQLREVRNAFQRRQKPLDDALEAATIALQEGKQRAHADKAAAIRSGFVAELTGDVDEVGDVIARFIRHSDDRESQRREYLSTAEALGAREPGLHQTPTVAGVNLSSTVEAEAAAIAGFVAPLLRRGSQGVLADQLSSLAKNGQRFPKETS